MPRGRQEGGVPARGGRARPYRSAPPPSPAAPPPAPPLKAARPPRRAHRPAHRPTPLLAAPRRSPPPRCHCGAGACCWPRCSPLPPPLRRPSARSAASGRAARLCPPPAPAGPCWTPAAVVASAGRRRASCAAARAGRCAVRGSSASCPPAASRPRPPCASGRPWGAACAPAAKPCAAATGSATPAPASCGPPAAAPSGSASRPSSPSSAEPAGRVRAGGGGGCCGAGTSQVLRFGPVGVCFLLWVQERGAGGLGAPVQEAPCCPGWCLASRGQERREGLAWAQVRYSSSVRN